ncbi:MAG TPA: tetratricopeptide repeat protein, partial [Candidatus Krumholzibacteria bacterium]|nr:tetratricopeptide repeat protein [Candidatus Krumholzibacteria bacterium]
KRGVRSERVDRQLGQALDEMGRPEEALAVLAPYRDKGMVRTRIAYAVALSDAGKNDEARRELERVQEDDPENPKVYENLGIVTLRQGQARAARKLLLRALALNSRLPISLNTLGVAQFRLGDPKAAVASWQKSVAIDPTQFDALFNIGLVAGHMGERETAIRAFKQFIQTAPKDRFAAEIKTAKKALAELEG